MFQILAKWHQEEASVVEGAEEDDMVQLAQLEVDAVMVVLRALGEHIILVFG